MGCGPKLTSLIYTKLLVFRRQTPAFRHSPVGQNGSATRRPRTRLVLSEALFDASHWGTLYEVESLSSTTTPAMTNHMEPLLLLLLLLLLLYYIILHYYYIIITLLNYYYYYYYYYY